jgi:hypothetical protein
MPATTHAMPAICSMRPWAELISEAGNHERSRDQRDTPAQGGKGLRGDRNTHSDCRQPPGQDHTHQEKRLNTRR